MMEDIAPGLLKKIRDDFEKAVKEDKIMKEIADLGQSATYADANRFAIRAGELLAQAYKNNLSSNVLPDGRMYYNIAKRIIPDTLKENYDLISGMTELIQQALNEQAGIGLKTIRPELNTDRIEGIVNKVSAAELYDDVAWVLGEPVINFSQSIVDDSIRENAEFHGKSGLMPQIIRKIAGGCCEWCAAVAGTYDYPDVPKDIYRRHERCRCTVEYDPKSGKRQNIWTKEWKANKNSDKIEKRKQIAPAQSKLKKQALEKKLNEEIGFINQLVKHPKMLQAYTPKGLKQALENAGYEVKPLGRGNLKGVSFEEGGGYRVSYGGDGYFQYHPEEGSHHNIPYYKTSRGNVMTRRYNMNGDEVDGDGKVVKRT
ncbi:MAG: hypothetical protein PUE22_01725 [Roseburia porci]|nr:hypothetical protein [Roseburia porci]